MAKRQRERERRKIEESDITGLQYFDQLAPLLERLHDDGCQRDRAGNRRLHYDKYCMLILLYLCNPIVSSLRGIQQASELKNVQRKLGCLRTSLGSLSEATHVFDPELLKEIVAELGDQLEPFAQDKPLAEIKQTITLVDGTLITALPQIMEASWRKANGASGLVKWRLHTHFELLRGVPTRIDVTPNGGAEHDERAVLEKLVESDRLYVADRGYAKFALFNKPAPSGGRGSSPPRAATSSARGTTACGRLSRRGIATTTRSSRRSSATRSCVFPTARRTADPITRSASSRFAQAPTRPAANIAAAPAGWTATASCGSQRTCWTSQRRSWRSYFHLAGRLKFSSDFSSTSSAAVIC